jgi:hypothetical protein
MWKCVTALYYNLGYIPFIGFIQRVTAVILYFLDSAVGENQSMMETKVFLERK